MGVLKIGIGTRFEEGVSPNRAIRDIRVYRDIGGSTGLPSGIQKITFIHLYMYTYIVLYKSIHLRMDMRDGLFFVRSSRSNFSKACGLRRTKYLPKVGYCGFLLVADREWRNGSLWQSLDER